MQLPLAIEFPETATFESYHPGPNQLLIDVLQQAAVGAGERQVYCWSESGLGKTHLLQACCRAAADAQLSACYLPLSQLLQHGAQALEGLESVDVLALDELQQIAGDLSWERAIFSLINQSRAHNRRLVLAAENNTHELPWALPDLASRLVWGPVFQIKPLSDIDKLSVLQARASRRGIELADEVANYMLSHFARDLPFLCQQLDKLDRASLAEQRRLTIPFIKKVLEVS